MRLLLIAGALPGGLAACYGTSRIPLCRAVRLTSQEKCRAMKLRSVNVSGITQVLHRGELVGFYFRVLEEGELAAGDAITVTPSEYARISVAEVSLVRFFDSGNRPMIERILSNPALAGAWRDDFEDLLANRR